ncbi:hypothetical protein BGW38_004140 [Lunasporangiospora selenospora]|uniref:Uncharacterized protein n=1 Tax=Lunasporangiospora selenospora TaxID=979761 RepID=A0A9P6FQ69_9FUNG|nr:hypothetical protein BGW38_004140 [Lunasporangiospora selenospora]
MFFKSVSIAALAFAVVVYSQDTPLNRTTFTNPVGDNMVYTSGENATFSWQTSCVSPSIWTSQTPSKVAVQLVNSTNSNNAFYLQDVTTIDCSKTQGNNYWQVPGKYDSNTLFSLKIVLDQGNVYSGRFYIRSKDTPSASPTDSSNGSEPKSSDAASMGVGPIISGVTALVSAVCLLF